MNNNWMELDINKMVELFKSGKLLKDLSQIFKCCLTTVKRRLKKELGMETYNKILGKRARK